MTGTSAGSLTRRTLLAGTVAAGAAGMVACRSDNETPGGTNGAGPTECGKHRPASGPCALRRGGPGPARHRRWCGAGAILFGGDEDIVTAQHEYLSRAIPQGADDASLGLYSESATSAAASFTGPMNDTLREVLQERRTLDDWDDAVERWKKNVGDDMRAEYEAAASGA